MKIPTFVLLTLSSVSCAPTCETPSSPLSVEVFNPGNASIFDVSSEILTTNKSVTLFDAQFQKNDAETVLQKIRDTQKPLDLIYISHSDPDYYFGLDVIQDEFPDVPIIATRAIVEAIEKTKDLKVQTWSSQLGDNAPTRIVVPQPIDVGSCGFAFQIDGGHNVYVYGAQANRTFNWIPSIGTVLGGVLVSANSHLWLADTKTLESRELWLQSLSQMKDLNPSKVIPGHYFKNADGTNPYSVQESIDFTANYIRAFDEEASRTGNSTQLINAMEARYPNLAGTSDLEMSAQVIKGEVAWP